MITESSRQLVCLVNGIFNARFVFKLCTGLKGIESPARAGCECSLFEIASMISNYQSFIIVYTFGMCIYEFILNYKLFPGTNSRDSISEHSRAQGGPLPVTARLAIEAFGYRLKLHFDAFVQTCRVLIEPDRVSCTNRTIKSHALQHHETGTGLQCVQTALTGGSIRER